MKKFLIPVLVLIMLLASIAPAYARGGGGAGNGVRLQGYINEIDKDDMTFTLLVTSGSDYVGQEITIQVTKSTTLKVYTSDGCVEYKPFDFTILLSDHRVGVTGIFNGDLLFAKVVVIH